MPKYCSSVGCKSREYKDARKDGLTFHQYPKDETRRNLWAKAVRRQNSDGSEWKPTNSSYLCSEHFKPHDFKTNSTNMRKLNEDAIPSVFKEHPQHLQKKSPRKRQLPFRQRQEDETNAAKRYFLFHKKNIFTKWRGFHEILIGLLVFLIIRLQI